MTSKPMSVPIKHKEKSTKTEHGKFLLHSSLIKAATKNVFLIPLLQLRMYAQKISHLIDLRMRVQKHSIKVDILYLSAKSNRQLLPD